MTTPDATKSQLRRELSAARRAVPAEVRAEEATALATALTAGPLPADPPGPVCAYWPVGSEPGSPAMLDALRERGWRVLLPVVAPAGPLDWAEYEGVASLRPGPFGLSEPAGSRLGVTAIESATLVLVPALAVDQNGVRLGRGGGHYDRTLPLVRPGTPLVVVVRDDEVVPTLPAETHDVPVSAVLTPQGGLRPLGR